VFENTARYQFLRTTFSFLSSLKNITLWYSFWCIAWSARPPELLLVEAQEAHGLQEKIAGKRMANVSNPVVR